MTCRDFSPKSLLMALMASKINNQLNVSKITQKERIFKIHLYITLQVSASNLLVQLG